MRQLITLISIALSVGLDGFAVATSIVLSRLSKAVKIRIAVVFGLFETVMPLLGVVAGHRLSGLFDGKASLIGGVLLIATAVFQLVGNRNREEKQDIKMATKDWRSTVMAALAVSIDNLVVGFSLGTRNVSLPLAAVIIGVVSIGLVAAGLELGRRIGNRIGAYGDYLASAILFAVGIAIILKLI